MATATPPQLSTHNTTHPMPSKVSNIRRSSRTHQQRQVYTDSGNAAHPIKAAERKGKWKHTERHVEVVEKVVLKEGPASESKLVHTDSTSTNKKVVWENYSKKDLYYKWLKARNDATDLRKDKIDLDNIRKELTKELKELKQELKEADSFYKAGKTLERENDRLVCQLNDEKEKSKKAISTKNSLIQTKKEMMDSIKKNTTVWQAKGSMKILLPWESYN